VLLLLVAGLLCATSVCAQESMPMPEPAALPSCTNADGSTSTIYNAQSDRFVTGLRFAVNGNITTPFLDCGSDTGFAIMDDGAAEAPFGTVDLPPIALSIVTDAFYADVPMTMRQVIQSVQNAGFEVRAADPASDCMCNQEMRDALG
jgi:hypothetical protein